MTDRITNVFMQMLNQNAVEIPNTIRRWTPRTPAQHINVELTVESPESLPVVSFVRAKAAIARSTQDWGAPPNYNAEYRRLRWPSAARVSRLQPGLRIPVTTPLWKVILRRDMGRKDMRLWNFRDTRNSLLRDLKQCVSLGIPIKTKSFEFKPAEAAIYINGRKSVVIDYYSGCVRSFCYNGVRDNLVSAFLRSLGMEIKVENRKLMWTTRTHGLGRTILMKTEIDLNKTYEILNIGAVLDNIVICQDLFSIFRRNNLYSNNEGLNV